MTNYDKIMAVMSVNRMAYLMARTTPCEKCPIGLNCPDSDEETNCYYYFVEWLQKEAKK